jgi:hypothetical protein
MADPNPFRYSPDAERSGSPTELPDQDTEDFTSPAGEQDDTGTVSDRESANPPSGFEGDAVQDTRPVEREDEPETALGESGVGDEPVEPL